MSRKPRRQFTDKFKQQIVDLYHAGKKRSDIIREYDLTPSSLDKWVKQSKTTGSFRTVDNLTDEQRELKKITNKLRTLLKKEENLVNLRLEGKISDSIYNEKYNELFSEKEYGNPFA